MKKGTATKPQFTPCTGSLPLSRIDTIATVWRGDMPPAIPLHNPLHGKRADTPEPVYILHCLHTERTGAYTMETHTKHGPYVDTMLIHAIRGFVHADKIAAELKQAFKIAANAKRGTVITLTTRDKYQYKLQKAN